MKLAVLAAANSWYAQDLRRAAGSQYELATVPFSQIHSTIDPAGVRVGASGIELTRFDAVLVRTMPPGSLEQVVFRMDALHHLQAAGCLVINSPRAIETAVDKYLTLARLRQRGLPVPTTFVCQNSDEAMEAFLRPLGQDAVVKPVFGSEGRGITRINDPAIALRTFRLLEQLGAVLYLQEFIPHEGFDTRILLVGDAFFAMRRCHPTDWRTNVSRGATTEACTPTEGMLRLARQAAEATGARIAGVDILAARDGREILIEVNAVPGWRALARTVGVDIAAHVLQFVEQEWTGSRRSAALA